MGNTENGFGKERDHNQYGDTEKERKERKEDINKEKAPGEKEQGSHDAGQ